MPSFQSQTVAEANQRRLKAKTPTIDEKWKYTYYLVKCIHFGEARQTGKGIRPKQKHFAKGCTAMISVSYDGDLRKLVVRKCNLLHNHRLGHGILQH